jgi:excisionase family DNA binding protein
MGVLIQGLTVQEAAAALDVSRIRVQHMISNHQLAAERVGNRWIIPRHEVFRVQRIPRTGGRPYSAKRCWDTIDDVCHGRRPLEWLHENWHLLRGRARHTTGRMLPDVIPEVYDDPDVVVGGAHAAADRGASARPFTPPLDVYLPEARAESYAISIGLRPVTAEPNVTIHAVTGEHWELLSTSRTVNLVVAYTDLMEAGDRAADEVYRQLQLGRQ